MKCYTCRFVASGRDGSDDRVQRGVVGLPGSVHASCVAMVLAAQSVGTSYIYGAPQSYEIAGTASALRSLGIKISEASKCITVEGVGVGGFAAAEHGICVGGAPYVACLMLGILSTHPFTSFIVNRENNLNLVRDRRLLEADIVELMETLAPIGAKFLHNNLFPLVITGAEDIAPLCERRIISSHFVKSSLLLACANIAGQSCISAHSALPAHTEWLLRSYGADVQVRSQCEIDEIIVGGHRELVSRSVQIFPTRAHVLVSVALALITPGVSISIPKVLIDKGMRVVLDVLIRMGGDIIVSESTDGLHVLEIVASETLGVEICCSELRFILEVFPILCVICACSEGITRIFGISEMPSDLRKSLEIVVRGLTQCGIVATFLSDMLEIQGCGGVIPGGVAISAGYDPISALALLLFTSISLAPIYVSEIDEGELSSFSQILSGLNGRNRNFVLESL